MRNENMPSEVVGVKAVSFDDTARYRDRSARDPGSKVKTYRSACQKADALAVAKTECRKLIDVCLQKSTEDAAAFSQAMMVVGAAASRHLGDPEKTAFLLGHLSRRIREGEQVDF